ncbi:nucleotidyltransferase domain-containing protein, partial [Desulfobacterota bacterium AH_259_B03_O07]|nr:nucleotidyltransferase domain-containing protein [Desulfobacterota bacterium AH_259_B03_O07]
WLKMVNEQFNILKLLIEHSEEKFSIRKISKIRNINYKSAYQAIKKLLEKNLIISENLGNVREISFTLKFDPLVYEVENDRRQKLLNNTNFKVLYNHVYDFEHPIIVLLFGSNAKQVKNKKSDIDLLIITDHQKEIERELNLLPLPIHLTIITYKDFVEMSTSKKFNVVNEALKKNIILAGIEEYYRLLDHVRQKTD